MPPKPVETAKPVEPLALATPPAREASSGHRGLGLILGASGIALEGGALVFALLGRSAEGEVEKATMWTPHDSELQSAGERDNKLAWGLCAAGGAAIIAGAVLYFTGGASAEHGVAIVPTRGGAQLGWSTSF